MSAGIAVAINIVLMGAIFAAIVGICAWGIVSQRRDVSAIYGWRRTRSQPRTSQPTLPRTSQPTLPRTSQPHPTGAMQSRTRVRQPVRPYAS
jgi:hypothetical protein